MAGLGSGIITAIMPKLVILDGNSLLYRGFFAMRALSTSDRLPTNAVYSFILMLLTILEREKPDAIFAAFDPPVATFRHKELESYKGKRLAMPDDLKPQRALAREAAAAFRVPNVEIDGYEADDVCGTLAEIGKNKGYDVLIVTGDGDALQLVDDGSPLEGRGTVKTMITVKGVTDTVVYDEAAVVARYGLTPAQITDFKGIKGDASDNLPGVPGIGEKGASKLLKEYGTLENLLFHVDELPEKTKNALITHTDSAIQCKRLATIVRDVPLPEWVDLTPNYQEVGPDFEAIKELFERLEFRTLLKRVPGLERDQRAKALEPTAETPVSSVPSSVEGQMVTTLEQMEALLTRLAEADAPVGIQLHLTPPPGVKPAALTLVNAELVGIAFGLPDSAFYADWGEWGKALTHYLQEESRAKSVYDMKLAVGVLGRYGVSLRGVTFDCLLAAYLLNAGRTGYPLVDLAADNAGIELMPDSENPQAVVMDEACAIQSLEAVLAPRLQRDGLQAIFSDIELPLAPILAGMERVGVSIDASLLREVSQKLGVQIAALEAEIFEMAGQTFSVGSTKQLQEVLFEKLKLPSGKKTKTGYSTGAEVLEDLASKGHEIARKIVQWREVSKLKSTYADALPALINPQTGKVHTSLNQTVASTGRLSSSNPNLQNIPIRTEIGREIRKGFVASPGYVLVSADYSQIELRLFAHITKDPGLVEAFLTDADIHAQTARRIFEVPDDQPVTSDQRRQAKTINFAVIYGASAFRVAVELGIAQARAAELIKAYLDLYPGVRAYLETVLEGAREKGYVQTLLGRRRYVPDINSRVFQFRQAAEREAANMPVQGTSADIIKLAMLRVDKALRESGSKAQMVLQVHDELLFECPKDAVRPLADLVRDAMQNAFPLDVPLRVEVKTGHNWWEVTPVDDDAIEAEVAERGEKAITDGLFAVTAE
jgi:DNA polymerase-1